MWSIYQSILASPLVTNGLVELVEPSIGPSRLYSREGFPDTFLNESEMLPAVYVEGASNITYDRSFQNRNFGQPFDAINDDRTNRVPVGANLRRSAIVRASREQHDLWKRWSCIGLFGTRNARA